MIYGTGKHSYELVEGWAKLPAGWSFLAPYAIAMDSRGDLYIGEVPMTHNKIDRGARAVQKFARK